MERTKILMVNDDGLIQLKDWIDKDKLISYLEKVKSKVIKVLYILYPDIKEENWESYINTEIVAQTINYASSINKELSIIKDDFHNKLHIFMEDMNLYDEVFKEAFSDKKLSWIEYFLLFVIWSNEYKKYLFEKYNYLTQILEPKNDELEKVESYLESLHEKVFLSSREILYKEYFKKHNKIFDFYSLYNDIIYDVEFVEDKIKLSSIFNNTKLSYSQIRNKLISIELEKIEQIILKIKKWSIYKIV